MARKRQPTPIFEALNNSLLFAMALIGLVVYVYQNDQSRQDGRLDATSIFIEGIQKKQDAQNDILLRMQEAQGTIAKQIERNTDKINAMNLDRFTDRDGNSLRQILTEKFEQEQSARKQQRTETREWLRSLESEFELMKTQITNCKPN